jgi:ABC-type spermidine/putrescine transport system permease subunit I
MFKSDLNSRLNRTIFVVIGLIIGFGIASIRHVGLTYHNWWNGAVFGPFAIIIGIVFIALMFKLVSLGSEMKKHPRKLAKRIRHRF